MRNPGCADWSEVPEASIAIARSKMKDYKLENTKLIVLQG